MWGRVKTNYALECEVLQLKQKLATQQRLQEQLARHVGALVAYLDLEYVTPSAEPYFKRKGGKRG